MSIQSPVLRRDSSDFIVPLLGDQGQSRRMSRANNGEGRSLLSSNHNNQEGVRRLMWGNGRMPKFGRRAFGILLLLLVIVLWVASSFLVSAIFSEDTYSKPYLVNYINTSSFALYLLPWAFKQLRRRHRSGRGAWSFKGAGVESSASYAPVSATEDDETMNPRVDCPAHQKLSTRETMRVSLEFCILWFVANWFASACLRYTSVASTTILSSCSGIFTLVLGAIFKVERFSWIKFLAITVSLAGVTLISTSDISNEPDSTNGSAMARAVSTLGNKSGPVTLLGDGMALIGAFCYGLYTVLLKVRIGHESRISMQLFFGFVGLFNFVILWPGLVVVHYTGLEKFELPPSKDVYWIVAINAFITLVSDFAWVFAMLFTTPVIVTVGLSMSIPLALLGQMVIQGKNSSWVYWIGAMLVFGAFLVINQGSELEESIAPGGDVESNENLAVAAAAGAGSAAAGMGVEADNGARYHDRPLSSA